ncbi:hypothetical protein GCM10022276_01300 [Sphingomonas limnosediminicola]|uniref:PilZ domain-containing protein n=1 Tax=Sphingomonas limnosediminicola TaxID=940133 RepID=A0ABP7KV04_9SPHN
MTKRSVPTPPQPEPRREPRRAVDLAGFALLEDGSTLELALTDLSYDGCQVKTDEVLEPGTKLKLSVVRLGALDAYVRWCADGRAGLSFNPDASFEREVAPRKYDRIELAAEVQLRRVGRQKYQGRTFDVSPKGCKVEFIERPRAGEMLWIGFDGLDPVEAEVRWIDGFFGGVEFVRPIYPAVFDLLLARLGASA